MKSPFRALRRKLFEEGKLLNYTGYAIGEILLIIIGILIALKISDWNNYRQDRAEEAEYLQLILAELEQSVTDQEIAIEGYKDRNALMQKGVEVVYTNGINEDNFEELNFLRSLGWDRIPVTTDSLDELYFSGKILLIRSRPLRVELSRFRTNILKYHKDSDRFEEVLNVNNSKLAEIVMLAPIKTEQSMKIVTPIEELNSDIRYYNLFNERAKFHRFHLNSYNLLHDQTKAMRDTLQEYIENQE